MNSKIEIAAGSARSIELHRNQKVRIVNTYGGQVVDTWAFCCGDMNEFLSMAHCRTALYRLWFREGDTLVSNRFRPMIKLTKDTSPGMHDTLHAACSLGSYRFFGKGEDHPNCQDNLISELAKRGWKVSDIPNPWNLFEHAFVNQDMTLYDSPASAKAGDYVELTALEDLILICSACPSTVGGISGNKPGSVAFQFF